MYRSEHQRVSHLKRSQKDEIFQRRQFREHGRLVLEYVRGQSGESIDDPENRSATTGSSVGNAVAQ
jgi:hypothetical protein